MENKQKTCSPTEMFTVHGCQNSDTKYRTRSECDPDTMPWTLKTCHNLIIIDQKQIHKGDHDTNGSLFFL